MSRIIDISDPDDPRIAVFRDVRERDVRGRAGGFIAEGEVVLRALLRSPLHRPKHLLIAAHRLARLAPLLAALDEGVDIFTAAQPVMDATVGFPIHRGILAFGESRAEPGAAELLSGLGPEAVILALFGIANHDNLGGIFRNAAAFGVAAVLLDATCCDPLYRKAIRVSVGAALSVPFARLAPGEDAVALLRDHAFELLALSPGGLEPLHGLRRPVRPAVLLGTEGEGLARSVLGRCRTITIPMAAGFNSLNVATTSGIVLHHLANAAA